MTFDAKTMAGVATTWLETKVRYHGIGRAEFTNPPGVVEGPATVSFDRSGICRVRITVERIEAPAPSQFTLRPGGAFSTYLVHGDTNPCRSLTVQTDAGIFTAGDRIIHDGLPLGGLQKFDLRPLQSQFEVAGAGTPKYWVLPLANFIPDPWDGGRFPQFADHPLRLCTWPDVPEGLSDDEKSLANLYLHQHASVFTFLVNGEPGFIERMPGYDARVRKVCRHRSHRITAVMVGPAHVQSVDWSDFGGLFPLDILSVLSLATGTPVGAPWIEFRDETGELVRRAHICFGAVQYEQHHAAIPQHLVRNGPGYLVGKVLAAADRGKKYLRAAMNHLLSAKKRGTMESRFINLCRGFETLCRHHGFKNQNLSARLEPAQQSAVKSILKDAEDKVRAMQAAETDPGRKAVLDAIASRIPGAAQTEKSFGLAVADLAAKFGFHDAAVLNAHLQARPHHTGKPWPGVLTYYRAASTHDAYFDFASREDLYAVMRVMNHLHDLLLRVLLKSIEYDGPYQSPIPPVMDRPSVDWVTPTTPAGLLGYD